MSFDLLLRPEKPIGFDAFARRFAEHSHFFVEEDQRQVVYENRDTGVAFFVDWLGPEDEGGPGLNFSLNTFRPKVFGQEAAAPLMRLIEELGCDVALDGEAQNGAAQAGGSQAGESQAGERYDAALFLRQWERSNALAYRSIAALLRNEYPGESREALMRRLAEENGVLLAPGAEIAAAWRWNVKKEEAAEELDLDDAAYFLPGLLWLTENETGARSVVAVWPSEVPIVLPLAAERIIAPMTGPDGGPSGDHALVSMADLQAAAPGAPCVVGGQQAARYNHGFEELPEAFLESVRAAGPLQPLKERVTIYAPSALRDLDMMRAAFDAAGGV